MLNIFFFRLFSLHKQCVGIPILKKVMSYVHKSVTSDVILNKSLIFSIMADRLKLSQNAV